MESARKLIAIMFTDIAGYSAMMSSDEFRALNTLAENRLIHQRWILNFRGQLIKEIGDGMLASFHSSSDAVSCAIGIQRECLAKNINLRIGIHQGEVTFENEDVLGDGVNIAARVEKLGVPGSILITKATRDQIRNKSEYSSQPLGEFLLHNIDEKQTLYAIDVEGIVVPHPDQILDKFLRISGQTPPNRKFFVKPLFGVILLASILLGSLIFYFLPRQSGQKVQDPLLTQSSIAVLPFVNMSQDPDQDYFADGMVEEILNRLFQVSDLTIRSRTSSARFKNTDLSTSEIAEKLGVSNLLEGSVSISEDQVRIIVKLIDGLADTTRWSETYNREMADIFELQSDIAYSVASRLKSEIGYEVAERMEYAPTDDPEVWKLFMRAKYSETHYDDFSTADSLLRKAIELEPSFAPAHAELGYLWLWRGSYMGDLEPSEILDMVFENLNKARELDPQYPTTHVYLAALNLWFRWDFEGAEKEWQEFFHLNPSNHTNDPGYVDFLNASGRFQEAVEVSNRMLREDASVSDSWSTTGLSFFFDGNPEKAVRHYEEALQLFPISSIISDAARTFVYTGRYQRVLDILAGELEDVTQASPRSLGNAAIAHHHLGNRSDCDKLLNILKQRSDKSTVGSPAFYTAQVLAQRGELDEAFDFLDRALKGREVEMFWLMVEPPFEPLRTDVRWQYFLNEVGFM